MSDQRGKHEGSVYQRNDGRWVGSVSIDGKRFYGYGKTVWEAIEKLEELKREHSSAQSHDASSITLEEWVESWLQEIGPDLRPSTLNTYRHTLKPIVAQLAHISLRDVSPRLLSEAFAKLRQSGKGARQLNLGHGYLKTCLKHAVNLDVLDKNPMEKVRRPKWDPKKRQYWDIPEVTRFIETGNAGERYWDPLFVFLCVTGLRISEALGLEWSDVSFETQCVRVQRALVWRGSEYDMLPPKTTAGTRDVSLPQVAIDALKVVEARSDAPANEPVFRTRFGTPPKLRDLATHLASMCDRAGVPRTNVHGLRHIAAMLALEAVDDPYLVQKRLGHSHISVTLGIYGYTTKNESQIGSQMDKLFGPVSDSDPDSR